MRVFIIAFITLLALSSCATFGIQHISRSNAQENSAYTLTVRAWDKKQQFLSVFFFYRINAGRWQEVQGSFNGEYFEYTIKGDELQIGTLEYYAQIINSKQETIQSKISRITILSFAQAKKQKEKEYFSFIQNETEYNEFYYNEIISLQIYIREVKNLDKVLCNIISDGKTEIYPAQNKGDGFFEVRLSPPHYTNSYTHQWQISWNDDRFGKITSFFPIVKKQNSVYTQQDLKNQLEKDFQKALIVKKQEFLVGDKKLEIYIEKNYSSFLERFSLDQLKMNLILRRKNGLLKIYKMDDLYRNASVFYVQIPFNDLADGNEVFSILYDDVFDGAGVIEKEFPPKDFFPIRKMP
ncbi:MAG: hypothetical protein ACRC5H_02205 [Treponemataceae bacterium]